MLRHAALLPLAAAGLLATLPMWCASAFAAPAPLPPNPVVQQMVDQISADELRVSIETLQSFHTRHTNSDTLSTTRGIGAARRWIHSRFVASGSLPGHTLEPGWFDFDSVVCGRAGHHRNVLATLTGTGGLERSFLVGAHMDSRSVETCNDTSFAPGANDDGSGTAILIELARVMSSVRFDAGVILTAFTGEEQGLIGSKAYATWAQAQGMRIDGMVSNDVVGNIVGCANPACPAGAAVVTDSSRVRHFSAGPSHSIHRQLTRAIKLSALRYVPGFAVDLIPARDRPNRGGDHMAFDARGYAAARLTEPNEHYTGGATTGRQHNELDVAADIDAAYLARVAKVNLAGIASLALAPEAPPRSTVIALSPNSIQIAWPSTSSAPDLAGYRVAFRDTAADSVFYFEIRDVGVTPGVEQVRVIADIAHGLPVFVSVSAYDSSFNESVFSEEVFVAPPVTAVAGMRAVPAARLHAAEPNPARRETRFRFDLERPGSVTLEVYDIHGRRVHRLASGPYPSGAWAASWHSEDERGALAPAGVYLARLSVDGVTVATRRFVRLD
jgi:Peptidase family M28/FlgD Ig-like domain